MRLPDEVIRRIASRLETGWTGTITLDVKDGIVRKVGYAEYERIEHESDRLQA